MDKQRGNGTGRGDGRDLGELVLVDQVLPLKLPVVPLFARPIFPGMLTPLMINEGRMVAAVDQAMAADSYIGLVLTRHEESTGDPEDLYTVGTVARILKRINLPDGSVNIFVNTVKRLRIRKVLASEPVTVALVTYENEPEDDDDEIKALARAVISQVKEISESNPLFTEEMRMTLVNVKGPARLADFVASILNVTREEQQAVLEEARLRERLYMVLKLLAKEKELAELSRKIQSQINEKISTQQREFFLREQLKAIRQELGMEVDEKTSDYNKFKETFDKLALDGEAGEKIAQELAKLQVTDTHSPEYSTLRTWLETALALPWRAVTDDRIDVRRAAKILDQDHFGLEEIKQRILEFLAVQSLKPGARGSILCLVGPPGVGKTSLGKSVARAMDRKFFRFSLGGMRDEAEIKGHRRTYVGAMPGKIVEALKIAKTRNPVLMLDEIDKLGKSFQGDPSSALLEVLDPEQNDSFRDHYLDIPFDLSDVFFITTANTLDTIPGPLLDRMEVIRLSGYLTDEKVAIAQRYIVPRALEQNGLPKGAVAFDKAALVGIANGYAREAGVRNMEKLVNKALRRVAFRRAAGESAGDVRIGEDDLKEYLGEPVFREERARKLDRPGLALGLAWTSMGGAVLTVECLAIAGKGGLKLTGQLGEVMSESASIAWSYVKQCGPGCGVPEDWFTAHDVHLHVPAGATPKDGPSAGITMASAMLSLVTGKRLRPGLAMTGELSLSGDVLPIGGLKEKLIAAKRNGIREVIVPAANEGDLAEIPAHVKKGFTVYLAERMEQVREIVFSKGAVDVPGKKVFQ